jgi:heptosyltransferase-2
MPFIKAHYKVYLNKYYLRRSLALTLKIKHLISGSKRMLERYVDPLVPFGVKYDGLGPEIFPDTTGALPFPVLQNKWIGIIPSAQWEGKRWPLERFKETIEQLLNRTQECFLIFGGPSDLFCTQLAESLNPDRVVNLQGKLTLEQVFHALTQVKLCIANDTGLMHIADAMNIPNVLIFGPTSADLGCLPFHPESRIIEHSLWCRPCSKNGQAPCIRGKRLCLELTSSEQVTQATLSLLKQL